MTETDNSTGVAPDVADPLTTDELQDIAQSLKDAGAPRAEIEAADRAAVLAEEKAELESTYPPALQPADRLLDHEFPPLSFAINPYFPNGEVTELVGAHGIFKSTAALAACLSVATGCHWGSTPVEKGRAVFITLEDSEGTLSRRVKAWLQGVPAEDRAEAEADVRSSFAYLAREHVQQLTLTRVGRGATLQDDSFVDHVARLVRGQMGRLLGSTTMRVAGPADLVVLETASRLHAGPETNEGLLVFAQALERIAMASGAAVVVVRHVSKTAARDGTTDSYVGRGGGSAADAARSVLVMAREPRGKDEDESDPLAPVRLVHAKSTHSRPGSDIAWRPVETAHGVYLAPMSGAARVARDADRLHAALAELGEEGLTKTSLREEPPDGLSRKRAAAAMQALLNDGRAVQAQEIRGKTKQRAIVYRVSASELEVASEPEVAPDLEVE